MALYSGETIEITTTALDFDGVTPITPTLLGTGTVTIEIVDSNEAPLVNGEALTWDDVREMWYFLWQTGGDTPVPPDTYQSKVTITGEDGTISFDYVRISVATPTF